MSCLKINTSWCIRRYLYHRYSEAFSVRQLVKHQSTSSKAWRSSDVRQTFLQYFKDRDHLYVHSSSIIPPKDAGTYFVNAGMNQFKPIFLGTVESTSEMAQYRRVVNSQKCIRISGKHNDLDDVGKDTFHHTFFEMLGNWSFGDYFKQEACQMAWKLLTDVYKLPKDRLYITYFGGNEALGVRADLECRDIWRNIGVSADHIMPFGCEDNFWDMGDTGPCGPCTEIHYDRTEAGNATRLVNTGSPDVVELWNLVFMQYDRQANGQLLPLPSKHVDTGMGLERLTAVLQSKLSNYDTDLFMPLFSTIQRDCKFEAYKGRLGQDDVDGRDTAYRIVADHARMFTVAIADGVRPGKHNLDSKLRHVIDQCLYQSIQILELPPGILARLVPVVVDILGDAFPELNRAVDKIQNIVDGAEHRYRELLIKGEEIISKICTGGTLNGNMLVDLQDGVWQKTGIPLDISLVVAAKLKIPNIDIEGFNKIMDLRKEKQRAAMITAAGRLLSQQDVVFLRNEGVPPTDDHYKYEQVWNQESLSFGKLEPGKVLAMKDEDGFIDQANERDVFMIITDKTPFYAEGGGQVSDIGTWENKNCIIAVENVQETNGYIVHSGRVVSGSVRIGDILRPRVDTTHRQQCAVNHTATHMLNFALRNVADDVTQQGSRVTPQKLVFDFGCSNMSLPDTCLDEITSLVNGLIKDKLDIYCKEIPLEQARSVPSLVTLQNEVYPSMARVVSVGIPVDDLVAKKDTGVRASTELCGGCHVDNSSRVGHFVITHFEGMKQQGTKRVTALTGNAAMQSLANVKKLRLSLDNLESMIKAGKSSDTWHKTLTSIEKQLFNEEDQVLPKIDREELIARIEKMKVKAVSHMKNVQKAEGLKQVLEKMLQESEGKKYSVEQLNEPQTMKKIVAALGQLSPDKPVMLFSGVPKDKAKKTAKFLPANISRSAKQTIAVAYVPNSFKNKFSDEQLIKATAEAWVTHLDLLSNGKRKTIGSVESKALTDGDVHFITLYTDDAQPLQYYMTHAQEYIEKLNN